MGRDRAPPLRGEPPHPDLHDHPDRGLIYQGSEIAHGTAGPTTLETTFNDPNATFTYKLPVSLAFGLAWREPRFDVEVDVRFHSAIPEYLLLASDQPVKQVLAIPGGEQIRGTAPFPGITYAANQVWNFSIGGRYQLDEAWSLHGGFYTDSAPADPNSTDAFRSVNLYGLTAGAKLKGDHLSGSLGLGLTWGSSSNFPLSDSGTVPFSSRLSILTVSLLYAIAYRF